MRNINWNYIIKFIINFFNSNISIFFILLVIFGNKPEREWIELKAYYKIDGGIYQARLQEEVDVDDLIKHPTVFSSKYSSIPLSEWKTVVYSVLSEKSPTKRDTIPIITAIITAKSPRRIP